MESHRFYPCRDTHEAVRTHIQVWLDHKSHTCPFHFSILTPMAISVQSTTGASCQWMGNGSAIDLMPSPTIDSMDPSRPRMGNGWALSPSSRPWVGDVRAILRQAPTYQLGGEKYGRSLSIRIKMQGDASKAQEVWENIGTDTLSVEETLASSEEIMELPSVESLIHILQKCRKEKNLDYAKRVHIHMGDIGLEAHEVLGNYLVPTFVECGSMYDGLHVFRKLFYQNEYAWTSILQGYAESGELQQAFDMYHKMQEEGISPSEHTLQALLKACARLKCIEMGRQVHGEVVKHDFEGDPFIGSTLVDMYAKCVSPLEAQEVFDELPARNAVSWTALIAAYAERLLSDESLYCLKQMQLEGVSPDAVTFTCSLKSCGIIGSIGKGQELHSYITKMGFERETSVGSALVEMYVKCGLLVEGQEVFDKLPKQDLTSWNALLTGYAQHGHGIVMNCLEQMQQKGVDANSVTFVCVLKACNSFGATGWGCELHAEIAREGFDGDVFVVKSLVDMYAKGGLLAEAQAVFDELPVRNLVLWNALLEGYAELGSCEEAKSYLEEMQCEGVPPSEVTFAHLLKGCCRQGAVECGREIHGEIAKRGFEGDPWVGCILVDMYAKCGSLVEALKVFDKLPVRNVVCLTAVIAGYLEHRQCVEALNCLEEMHMEGVSPDDVTFTCIFKACGSIGAIGVGQEHHAEVVKKGLEKHPFIGNALVGMYAECSSLVEAQDVFEGLPCQDLLLWNALIVMYVDYRLDTEALACIDRMHMKGISLDAVAFVCSLQACGRLRAIDQGREKHADIVKQGFLGASFVGNALVDMYVKCGRLKEAQKVFEDLPNQDVFSWTALITGYAEHGFVEEATVCLEEMQLAGVSPNAVTFICSLKACDSTGAVGRGLDIHGEIVKKGFERDCSLGTSLMDMYAKCGSLAEAQEVFDKLSLNNLVAWNALITGYIECGLHVEALDCVEKMHLNGVSPDAITFVCILKYCGSTRATSKGQETHGEIVKLGFERDLFIDNSLVDMYAKCGSFEEAWAVFDELVVCDVVSWNALIFGLAEHGLGERALKCLEQMWLEGVSFDAVTYVCSLKACSNIGANLQGQELHADMCKQGFERDFSILTTLVDMYARCGLFAEAEELFDELPVRDVVVWNALIANYAEHGLGDLVLNCLEEMELEDVSADGVTYVCCLKACGSVGAVDGVRQIHAAIVKEDFDTDPFVCNTLVDVYAKCDLLAEAHEVFDELPMRTVVSWNALIAGYAECGLGGDALKHLEQMHLEGVPMDEGTFVASLKACGSTIAVDRGRELHAEIVKVGSERDSCIGSTLVDMYGRLGSLIEAQEVFHQLPVPDEVSWTALIAAYAHHGFGEEALNCLLQMEVVGNSPNVVTFMCGLKACGKIGAIGNGQRIHAAIVMEGFERDSFIGNTLLDMYAKCGALADAYGVFDELPVQNIVSWNALLAGYACQGQTDLVFNLLDVMREQSIAPNGITFLTVLTACSHSGLVDKGQRYFEAYCKNLTIEHHNCLVDLLGRAGQLKLAAALLEKMPFQPNLVSWTTLLGACQKLGDVELGLDAFENVTRLDEKQAAVMILMSNMCVDVHMWEDMKMVEVSE